eukprot:1092609-Amphidinium_carterae.1
MQFDPGNEVLIAERSRLMRQAWRLWNLHTSGAIPPLDDQVAFEVTLILGLETPATTDAPVFPYVNRQSRKRSIHLILESRKEQWCGGYEGCGGMAERAKCEAKRHAIARRREIDVPAMGNFAPRFNH